MRRAIRTICARRRGMTVIELSMGLLVTGMVMASLAAVWSAVGQTWSNTTSSQQISLSGNQAALRLEDLLRQSKYVCQYTSGSLDGSASKAASVLLWKNDSWSVAPATSADGKPQLGELLLIEHSVPDQKIYVYEPIASSAMDASQKSRAGGVATWSDLSASTTPTTFKTYDFVRKKTLAESVSGASLYLPAQTTSARQGLEFTLKLSRSGTTSIVYGTGTLRGATTKPS